VCTLQSGGSRYSLFYCSVSSRCLQQFWPVNPLTVPPISVRKPHTGGGRGCTAPLLPATLKVVLFRKCPSWLSSFAIPFLPHCGSVDPIRRIVMVHPATNEMPNVLKFVYLSPHWPIIIPPLGFRRTAHIRALVSEGYFPSENCLSLITCAFVDGLPRHRSLSRRITHNPAPEPEHMRDRCLSSGGSGAISSNHTSEVSSLFPCVVRPKDITA